MITISYDIIFFLVVLIYYCSICICLSTFLCLFYLIIKYVLFIIREEFYEMKVKLCGDDETTSSYTLNKKREHWNTTGTPERNHREAKEKA